MIGLLQCKHCYSDTVQQLLSTDDSHWLRCELVQRLCTLVLCTYVSVWAQALASLTLLLLCFAGCHQVYLMAGKKVLEGLSEELASAVFQGDERDVLEFDLCLVGLQVTSSVYLVKSSIYYCCTY